MARSTKETLDYFPLDTSLDGEVQTLEDEYGNDGFANLIKLWQQCYRSVKGELNVSLIQRQKSLAKRGNVSHKRWLEIVEMCVSLGLFDKASYENEKILTSSGIKKRIAKVEKERIRGREKRRNIHGNTAEHTSDNREHTPEREIESEKGKGNTEKGKGNFETGTGKPEEKKAPPIPNAANISQFSHNDFVVRVLAAFRATQISRQVTVHQEKQIMSWWKVHGTDRMLWAINLYGDKYDKGNIDRLRDLLELGELVAANDIHPKLDQGQVNQLMGNYHPTTDVNKLFEK